MPKTVKSPRLHTHTPLDEESEDPALPKEPQSLTLAPSKLSKDTLPPNLLLLLIKDQSLLPLKPIELPSKVTPVVFLTPPLAEPHSITPSPLSDLETKTDKTTTSLETPGDQLGETKVTSISLLSKELPVSVVSNKLPSGQG